MNNNEYRLMPVKLLPAIRDALVESGKCFMPEYTWAAVIAAFDRVAANKPIMTSAPPLALAAELREYAANSGYSHQDYADVMRKAADELDRYCERFAGVDGVQQPAPIQSGKLEISAANSPTAEKAGGLLPLPETTLSAKVAGYTVKVYGAQHMHDYVLADRANRPTAVMAAGHTDANDICEMPHAGWYCTRKAGHDGPCAAHQHEPDRELDADDHASIAQGMARIHADTARRTAMGAGDLRAALAAPARPAQEQAQSVPEGWTMANAFSIFQDLTQAMEAISKGHQDSEEIARLMLKRTDAIHYQFRDAAAPIPPAPPAAIAAPMTDADICYELMQDDMVVAATSGNGAEQEIQRYAAQYLQDGPVEIVKCVRTVIAHLTRKDGAA